MGILLVPLLATGEAGEIMESRCTGGVYGIMVRFHRLLL